MTWRVALVTLGLALGAPAAAAASNGFVENVRVLHEWHGEANGYLGWAVSELTDIDRDHVTDLIFGEPNTPDGGHTWVYSGRTGRLIYRLPAQSPGEDQGYAIADAGDTNRDGVDDIISGAAAQTAGGPGRAYLYSGRSGRLLHVFEGTSAGDSLGSAVAGAGDQNHDGYDDVVVGAEGANVAYVFSGHTYKPIRQYHGAPGAGLGTGADSAGGGRLIIGALTENGTGGAHVFAGAHELFSLAPEPGAARFGQFFVAGVGRVDGDHVPDVYVGDWAGSFAGVYSGRDGSLIHGWAGAPGDGTGPGREAGDVNRDGRTDLAVGSFTASDGAPMAGRVDVRSGRSGNVLRTITSTTENENLGFDAVGVGDTNHDGRIDLLLSAAEGDTVYLVAGR